MNGHTTMNEYNPGVRSAGVSLLRAEAGATNTIYTGGLVSNAQHLSRSQA